MFGSPAEILSQSQLKRLDEHKYSCSSSSLLDARMQSYWNWLVGKLPMWLAPNLITVVGLAINVVTSLILIYYSPDARHEVPRWAFFLCALGLFVYQSMDAVDGKQARRTNTSSPLGELFDHGCDSISTVFVSLAACIAVKLGTNPDWLFFQCFISVSLFYSAHWQTYVSGTLRFGKFDVTEAQFSVMILFLISGIFGAGIWEIKIPGTNVDAKFVPAAIVLTGQAFCFICNFRFIFTGGIGKNGSSVAGTSVLSPCIPFSLVVVPAFIIYQKSITHIYEDHPCLYILAFGLVAAKVTNRLVVAHMTKSEMDYLDSVLIGPGMLFLNQYFNTTFNEYILLWICFVYVVIDLLRYSSTVCNQICRHLGIGLFVIPPVSKTPAQSSRTSNKNGTSSKRC